MRNQFWQKEELSAFCLEFSMLLKAGMSTGEGFLILSENEKNEVKKTILLNLYHKSMESTGVSESMAETGVFPPYMLRMIEIGQQTGHLEEVFSSLSRYFDERIRTGRILRETVLFPIILFVMMLAVVVLLLTEVLPIFQSVFAQLGGTLPTLALFFLGLGEKLRAGRYVFLALAVVVVLGCILAAFVPAINQYCKTLGHNFYGKTKAGRLGANAHFASALAMTISGGLDTDQALEQAEQLCGDTPIKENIQRCRQKLQEGEAFADAVAAENLFQPMYCRMLAIGIKSGNLDLVLGEIAERTEEEASRALLNAAAKVEPTVVIVLSVLVGILLLSVMFPLVGIMSSLG